MSIQNVKDMWTVQAAEALDDLAAGTGHIYKAVAADDRKIANNGKEAIGVIQQAQVSGNNVALGVSGIQKFTAGGAIGAGVRMTVSTSGYFVAVDSGLHAVGRNLTAAVASGAVGYGIFDFSNPHYIVSCADLP